MVEVDRSLRKFLADVSKKWGEHVLVPANKAYQPHIPRATWGNLLLDIASGGGFARGRIHRILGPESSGKSQTPLAAFAANQHLCNVCWKPAAQHEHDALTGTSRLPVPYPHEYIPFRMAWVDAEASTDMEWIERNGVKLISPSAPPEAQTLYLAQPGYAEEALDVLVQLVRSRHFSMVVFDSLGSISSTDELEKSAEDAAKVADTAKLINRTMRVLWSELASREEPERGKPAVFLINHLYSSINPYGPSDFTRGGRGQNYASSFDLYLERKQYMLPDGSTKFVGSYGKEGGTADEVIKQQIRFIVRKNKIGTPGKSGEYWSYVSEFNGQRPGNVDCGASLFEYGERYGVIKKVGSSYVLVSTGEEIETEKKRMAEKLLTDFALQKRVADALLEAVRLAKEDPTEEVDTSGGPVTIDVTATAAPAAQAG